MCNNTLKKMAICGATTVALSLAVDSAYAATVNWNVNDGVGNANGSGFTPNSRVDLYAMDPQSCPDAWGGPGGPWNCINNVDTVHLADPGINGGGSWSSGEFSYFCRLDYVFWAADFSSGVWYGTEFFGLSCPPG